MKPKLFDSICLNIWSAMNYPNSSGRLQEHVFEGAAQRDDGVDGDLALDELAGEVRGYLAELRAHINSLERTVLDDLWVSASFVDPATRALDKTLNTVTGLELRVATLRQGFLDLPQEEDVLPLGATTAKSGRKSKVPKRTTRRRPK